MQDRLDCEGSSSLAIELIATRARADFVGISQVRTALGRADLP